MLGIIAAGLQLIERVGVVRANPFQISDHLLKGQASIFMRTIDDGMKRFSRVVELKAVAFQRQQDHGDQSSFAHAARANHLNHTNMRLTQQPHNLLLLVHAVAEQMLIKRNAAPIDKAFTHGALLFLLFPLRLSITLQINRRCLRRRLQRPHKIIMLTLHIAGLFAQIIQARLPAFNHHWIRFMLDRILKQFDFGA